MKLKKFNQIIKEDRFGFDDIDEPSENKKRGDDNDPNAILAAKADLKSDPGYRRLIDDFDQDYGFDDYDDDDDDDDDDDFSDELEDEPRSGKGKSKISEEQEDAIRELTYLLRKMIRNSGVDNFYVSNDGYDIRIQFILQKLEKMRSIMRIINIIKKINDDILIQYDPEVEMWETNKGEPMFTVDFYYEANKKGYKKDVAPF